MSSLTVSVRVPSKGDDYIVNLTLYDDFTVEDAVCLAHEETGILANPLKPYFLDGPDGPLDATAIVADCIEEGDQLVFRAEIEEDSPKEDPPKEDQPMEEPPKVVPKEEPVVPVRSDLASLSSTPVKPVSVEPENTPIAEPVAVKPDIAKSVAEKPDNAEPVAVKPDISPIAESVDVKPDNAELVVVKPDNTPIAKPVIQANPIEPIVTTPVVPEPTMPTPSIPAVADDVDDDSDDGIEIMSFSPAVGVPIAAAADDEVELMSVTPADDSGGAMAAAAATEPAPEEDDSDDDIEIVTLTHSTSSSVMSDAISWAPFVKPAEPATTTATPATASTTTTVTASTTTMTSTKAAPTSVATSSAAPTSSTASSATGPAADAASPRRLGTLRIVGGGSSKMLPQGYVAAAAGTSSTAPTSTVASSTPSTPTSTAATTSTATTSGAPAKEAAASEAPPSEDLRAMLMQGEGIAAGAVMGGHVGNASAPDLGAESKGDTRASVRLPGTTSADSLRSETLQVRNPVLVLVEVPEQSVQQSVIVDKSGNVEDVLKRLQGKHSMHDLEDFGVFMVRPVDKKKKDDSGVVKIDKRKPIATIPANPQPHLQLVRHQLRCTVVVTSLGKELTLVEKPDITVRELEKRLVEIATRRVDLSEVVQNAGQHALYLPMRTGHGGTVLQSDRTLLSYRMKEGDKVHWRKRGEIPELMGHTGQIKAALGASGTGETLVLKIECNVDAVANVRGTFKLKRSMTVAEAMAMFTRKFSIKQSVGYGLVIPSNGREPAVVLDNLVRLSEYGQLKNFDRLEFAAVDTDVAARVRAGSALAVVGAFGAAPEAMEMVDDLGFQVPVVLRRMRLLLVKLGGLEEEGIFRLAGEEGEMKALKERLSDDLHGDSLLTNNPHNVATLIKRWFNMLPTRVFQRVPEATIRRLAEVAPDAIIELDEILPDPERTLLKWLATFLAEVAEHISANKMTTANLAVVVSPALAPDSRDNPMSSLMIASRVVVVVQRYLEFVARQRVQQQ